ncbi:MAG: hypothetical protein KC464_29790, partial [Myxococcales bacterium]|nr:hypothetical protein [Myxococcales bacterium]
TGAPDDPEAWVARAAVEPDADAYASLGQAVRLDPGHAAAWKQLCLVATRLDRPTAAADCKQAEQIGDREDPAIILARADLLERRGDLNAAAGLLMVAPGADSVLSIVLRRIDLAKKSDDWMSLRPLRERACALGDAPSCDADPDEGVPDVLVNPFGGRDSGVSGGADSGVTDDAGP